MTFPSDSTSADRLVEVAHRNFTFGQTMEKQYFAVCRHGPNVAMSIDDEGQREFRARLAAEYRDAFRKTPTKAQVNDALQVLLGCCANATPEPCYTRVAPSPDGGVVVDLSRRDGKAVVIHPRGPCRYSIVDRSPILFRQTPVMAEMPLPQSGGSLDEVPAAMGLRERHWELLLGWMLAAYIRDIPHPILALFGPAGAGKSCLAKLLVRMCDPSPAPLRSVPCRIEDWHIGAGNSWIYAIDNLSEMKPWLADLLSKAATGDARVVRQHYSNYGVAVTALKLPVILTAIEIGNWRADFGDRLVVLDLPRRESNLIATESALDTRVMSRLPFWLGALFDAISRTLELLPSIPPPSHLPRMADYGHVLACADAAGVTSKAYRVYMENRDDTANELAESDDLVQAITDLLGAIPGHRWQGTATELLQALNQHKKGVVPYGWPRAANQLSRQLTRSDPALKGLGVRCAAHRHATTRRRLLSLSLSEKSNPSFASSGHSVERGETAVTRAHIPSDSGTIPGRYPNDESTASAAIPTDRRTMPERWPGVCGPQPTGDCPSTTDGRSDSADAGCSERACPSCGSTRLINIPIHGGQSIRQDCADCERFVDFPQWRP